MGYVKTSTGAMAKGKVTPETRIEFHLFPADSKIVKTNAIDPENVKVAEQIFVKARLPVVEDGVTTGRIAPTAWKPLKDSTWATLDPGDAAKLRTILGKIHAQERLDADLVEDEP